MTYEEKTPRPDDNSHQPHWENNSLGSAPTDPYTARQSSPYQNNNEGWPSAKPSPVYGQNQPEPYWGNNRPPYVPQTSPFSNNNLPGGLPPLTREELEARHPRTPGKPRRELKDFFGLSIKDDVDKPSSGYQETAHNIVKGDSNSVNADSAISPTSATEKVKNLSKDIPGLSNEVGKPLDKDIQDKFTQKFKTSADYLQPIEVVHNQKSEAVNEVLGSKAVSAGKKIYMGKKGASDPRVLPYEVAHFHPKSIKEGSGLVKCWVKDDPAVKKAERRRREAEAERKRQAAIAKAQKDAADKAAADKAAKQSKETKTQAKNPFILKRRPPTDFTGLKEKIAQSSLDKQKQLGQANQTQQNKEQLQKTVQKFPAIKNILHQPDLVKGAMALGTISPKLGADLLLGAKLLKPSGDTFKSISPNKADVLAFNHNVVKGSQKIVQHAVKSQLLAAGKVGQRPKGLNQKTAQGVQPQTLMPSREPQGLVDPDLAREQYVALNQDGEQDRNPVTGTLKRTGALLWGLPTELFFAGTGAAQKGFDNSRAMANEGLAEGNWAKTMLGSGLAFIPSQFTKKNAPMSLAALATVPFSEAAIGTKFVQSLLPARAAAATTPWWLTKTFGGVLGGGVDLTAQMMTNKGDFGKVDPVSVAGSAMAGALGLKLGVNASSLTAAVGLGGKTLSSQLAGIGSRTLLNSAGSGVIGGGVTLAQNAFKKAILHQNIGLLDGVKDNAQLSAKFGAFGSFIGDFSEIGFKSGSQLLNNLLAQQAWQKLTLSEKLLSRSIQTYIKLSNIPSILGASVSNSISNSAPITNISKNEDNKQK